jgi:zinc/manganese transport system substrate-binding protein
MYGSVAKEIGGDNVNVTSILNNPNQDPHFFSASPSTARAVSQADIIIYNGIAYDPWMEKLLSVQKASSQRVIIVADLVGAKMGENPHLWYSPNTMPTFAAALTKILQQQDPAHKEDYARGLGKFQQNYQLLTNKIRQIRHQYQSISVIATEPLFGYMAQALGFKMLSTDFQINVMNNVEPTPTQLRQFEQALNSHTARILFYNQQVIGPLTQQLQVKAKNQGIPIVGITETQPQDISYVQWMLNQLNRVEIALDANSTK